MWPGHRGKSSKCTLQPRSSTTSICSWLAASEARRKVKAPGLVVQPATWTTNRHVPLFNSSGRNGGAISCHSGADDVRLDLALLSSLLAILFPGADRVSTRAEPTRLLLTAGATEGVDLTCKLYSDQTCTADHGLPPCTRQGTGDSAGPEVDVLERAFWHRLLYADVGDRHAAAAL